MSFPLTRVLLKSLHSLFNHHFTPLTVQVEQLIHPCLHPWSPGSPSHLPLPSHPTNYSLHLFPILSLQLFRQLTTSLPADIYPFLVTILTQERLSLLLCPPCQSRDTVLVDMSAPAPASCDFPRPLRRPLGRPGNRLVAHKTFEYVAGPRRAVLRELQWKEDALQEVEERVFCSLRGSGCLYVFALRVLRVCGMGTEEWDFVGR